MKNDQPHVLTRGIVLKDNHILVCKTLDLAKNFYFLPGGHVEHGESAQQALLREIQEEVGVEASIQKFLGCLEYIFEPGHSSICHNHEYTFIFQVESPFLSPQMPLTQQVNHLELTWLPVSSLGDVDFRAEPLKKVILDWIKNHHFQSFSSAVLI